jgi:hypothetical protein
MEGVTKMIAYMVWEWCECSEIPTAYFKKFEDAEAHGKQEYGDPGPHWGIESLEIQETFKPAKKVSK